jgi:hypothetical protein
MYRPAFLETLALVFPASRLGAQDNVRRNPHLAKPIARAANNLPVVRRQKRRRPREFSFGWIGPAEAGKPVYYRVHGPTLLVEYENMPPLKPASGTGANHVHRVSRVPGNDFGENWLRRHHQQDQHKERSHV